MKKNLFSTFMMFVALAMVTLTSCSKDPEELILGDWNVEQAMMSASIGGFGMNMNLKDAFVKFSFSEDGMLTWCMREMEDMNEMMQPEWGTSVDTLHIPYVLDDDVLTLMCTEDICETPIEFKIKVLEKDELSLESIPFVIEDEIMGVFKLDFTK